MTILISMNLIFVFEIKHHSIYKYFTKVEITLMKIQFLTYTCTVQCRIHDLTSGGETRGGRISLKVFMVEVSLFSMFWPYFY